MLDSILAFCEYTSIETPMELAMNVLTLSQHERLADAFDAFTRAGARVAGGDMSADAVREEIRALNRLYDVSMDCGMSADEPVVVEWAGNVIVRALIDGERF